MSQSNRLEPVNEVSPAGPAPYPLNLFMNCFWNSEYFHASVAYLAHLEFRVNHWYVSCRLFILKSKLFSPAFNFFDQISSRANKKRLNFELIPYLMVITGQFLHAKILSCSSLFDSNLKLSIS